MKSNLYTDNTLFVQDFEIEKENNLSNRKNKNKKKENRKA
jgi:hypothetical protein